MEKIQHLKNEINSLKNELNDVNIINDKLNNLLLLEVESNCDKLKQNKNEYESKIISLREIIFDLNEETSDKDELLFCLNGEIEGLREDISDKDELLPCLNNETVNLKIEIDDKIELIKNFKEEISSLLITQNNNKMEINILNQKVNDLNDLNSQRDKYKNCLSNFGCVFRE